MFRFNHHHQGAYYLSLLKLYLAKNRCGWFILYSLGRVHVMQKCCSKIFQKKIVNKVYNFAFSLLRTIFFLYR
jgi:hypothetical protein